MSEYSARISTTALGDAATRPAPAAARIEHIEAAAWRDLQTALPVDFKERWGVSVGIFGGAIALRAANTPTPAINRIVGLGMGEPLTPELLDRVVAWYAEAGVQRFVIQLSPVAAPANAAELLASRGFEPRSYHAKLWRPLTGAERPRASAEFRIEEIGPDNATTFEHIVAAPLGVPPELGAGVRSTIGNPGWRHYLAFDGGRPVAGAACYIESDGAWLGLGATDEEFRRRGAQTALLMRRLADAAAAGCRWASADTAQQTVDRPNPSYRNMHRVGFVDFYDRPNYVGPNFAAAAGHLSS